MTDFQAAAVIQGAQYEEIVAAALVAMGWTVTHRHDHVDGVEIDISATDPLGAEWWIECKGSWRGSRPGAKRTDTVKKAIADAWLLSIASVSKPYMLITSHLPKVDSHGHRMLTLAQEHGLFTKIAELGALVPFDVEGDDE